MTETWISPIGEDGIYEINTGKWRTFRPVIDQAKCVKCAICAFFCPAQAVKRDITADRRSALHIDLGYCKGCGICAVECPRQAIAMVREEEK
jgi:2-oxoacid:acceptor oxidoreductase delta subunit (pyruvate/2-ketoisovalerate family)